MTTASDTLTPQPGEEATRLPGTLVFLDFGNKNSDAASAIDTQ